MKFRVLIIRAIMMEAASTSETSVDIDLRTRQYNPEDSELQAYVTQQRHHNNNVTLALRGRCGGGDCK
jgi:hypothetical protein